MKETQVGRAAGYEAPRLHMHGSLAEATASQVLGSVFDQTIPAGTPLTGIIGKTSF
jgi:hypothetical protein